MVNNRIRHYADRIRALEVERSELAADIKTILEEAEVEGIEPKALRKAMQLSKLDAGVRKRIEEYEGQLTLDLAAAA